MDIETSWGTIGVKRINGRVVSCSLPHLNQEPKVPFSIQISASDEISHFIASVFQGLNPSVPLLGKLDGTEFQQQVWQAIASIPLGQTRSYGELAQSIGRPSAFRAVANACGRNPVPLFIPCHRVIAANGKLGGFSSGLVWKKYLLSVERGS